MFLCFIIMFLCSIIMFLCFIIMLLCFIIMFLSFIIMFLCFIIMFLCFQILCLFIVGCRSFLFAFYRPASFSLFWPFSCLLLSLVFFLYSFSLHYPQSPDLFPHGPACARNTHRQPCCHHDRVLRCL